MDGGIGIEGFRNGTKVAAAVRTTPPATSRKFASAAPVEKLIQALVEILRFAQNDRLVLRS